MLPSVQSLNRWSKGWRTGAICFALSLAVVAVFQNSLRVPFLLDDEANILENESLSRLPQLGPVLWPRTDVFTAGRPLLNLSFALNHAWGGTDPRGYHVVNVAIHLLATLTLFALVRRTLLLPYFDGRFSRSADWIAGASALLWAVHPLQTASVTYVSQRAESLMGLCYLLTSYAFVRATARPGGWTWVTVGACFAGTMVKEVMMTAPVILFLFDCTFVAGSAREAWRIRHRMYLGLAATWIALGAILLTSRLADRGVGFRFALSWHEYLRLEFGAVLHYLRLTIFPHPLVFDFGDGIAKPAIGTVAVQAGFLALLVAGIVRALERRQAWGFLGAWFFLILAPTSSVVPVAGQPIAENRVYLPLAAVCVLATTAAVQRLGRRAIPVVLAAAVALGCRAVDRNYDYRSEVAIWNDTIAHRPMSSRANCYFGNALLKVGVLDAATSHLETAIRIEPRYFHAHVNLATAYLTQKRIDDAIRHYGIALQLKPNDPLALNNLGTAHFHAGQTGEALRWFQEALRVRPGFSMALLNTGIVLGRMGRFTEARAVFEQLVQQEPQNMAAQDHLRRIRAVIEKSPPVQAR